MMKMKALVRHALKKGRYTLDFGLVPHIKLEFMNKGTTSKKLLRIMISITSKNLLIIL